jgi:lysophospholipid acyltransferase (LPLAT)-like uncharacterized protein
MAALCILLFGQTWRFRWIGQEHLADLRTKGQRVIYAFWHGRMLALCFSHRRLRIHIMVSEHRDGEMIAQTIRLLGFIPVRGSTTRGGIKALFQMAHRASAGYDLAITPDGPRGPGFHVQQGVITLAQRTGMPIIPVANSASWKITLSSWDRYVIPLPFSRVAILLGAPIHVPRQLSSNDVEKKMIQVERALSALTRRADDVVDSSPSG